MAKTHFPESLNSLASALIALGDPLRPGGAQTPITRSRGYGIRSFRSRDLVWAPRYNVLPEAVVVPRGPAVVVAQALGAELSPPACLSYLPLLLQVSKPWPSQFSTQELVDLLKMPTCIGPAREVILWQLGQKYNRTFADVWEFVDYAHEPLPEVDLTTPPRRWQK
jgi:hypothetical protein